MKQSSLFPVSNHQGIHVAIIMDGNGRWATARGRARIAGHRAGADTVRRVVEAAPSLGIGTLTLYAFSADNWRRPPLEVQALMRLLRAFMRLELKRCIENGVRIQVIGRRDRLSNLVRQAIEQAETATSGGRQLLLRIAIDYSARDAILEAVQRLSASPQHEITRENFAKLLDNRELNGAPDVDLLIRTGGEQRLSDFLLWENAYAELYFTKRMWPEFEAQDLAVAVDEFMGRERRFGGLCQAV